jgi:enamine deaminase RidA (YjgF/YER057c/UK114 family)
MPDRARKRDLKMAAATQIDPGWAWAKRFRISWGLRVGDTLYISGLAAFGADGQIVGRGDMKAQARQTFRNIREVVEAAGGQMEDVVKITAFVTDLSQYAGYAEARTEAFPGTPPASATVGVSALLDPDLLVEIESIAYLKP